MKKPIKKTLKYVKDLRFLHPSFLGNQLSRLKMGQSYYSILMSTVNAISLITIAFNVDIYWLILLFPFALLIAFGIGFYLDKHNINSMDSLKSNEMSNRFLNTGDLKSQEFQLLQTEILLEALQTFQEGKKFDVESLRRKYGDYMIKWKAPDY
ncbi:MAG: hypothetical protein ACTSWY_08585 [Promethearchaeota archaeon]